MHVNCGVNHNHPVSCAFSLVTTAECILRLTVIVCFYMFSTSKLRSNSPVEWRCDEYAPMDNNYWLTLGSYTPDQRDTSISMDRLSLRLRNESLLKDTIEKLGRMPMSAIYKIITTHNTRLYREIIDECYSGSLCQFMCRHGLVHSTKKTDTDFIIGYIMRCVHGSHNPEGASVHRVHKYLQRHGIMALCNANDVIAFVRNQGNRFTITDSHTVPCRDWVVGYVSHVDNCNVTDLIVEVFGLACGDQVTMWAVLSLCRCHPSLFQVESLMMSDILRLISTNDRLVVEDGLCRLL